MKKNIIYVALAAVTMLTACSENNSNKVSEQPAADSVFVAGTACDISVGDIRFTRSINGADTLVTVADNGEITFLAGENKDFFCDPNGKLSNNTAPILLTEIDNTKPFTLMAKVQPEFTPTGIYNAGVLYLYEHNTHWQKFCFEQDERGNHRNSDSPHHRYKRRQQSRCCQRSGLRVFQILVGHTDHRLLLLT